MTIIRNEIILLKDSKRKNYKKNDIWILFLVVLKSSINQIFAIFQTWTRCVSYGCCSIGADQVPWKKKGENVRLITRKQKERCEKIMTKTFGFVVDISDKKIVVFHDISDGNRIDKL